MIATDRSLEPTVRAHLRDTDTRLRLIPNGLDVVDGDRLVRPEAGAALRRQHGIAIDDVLLVSVGRLEANKGFADLIDALGTIGTEIPWRWTLVGEGPERHQLVSAIAAKGFGNRVTFAGGSDDESLHAWYDAADLFVHPTRYEGSSLVTLEAMLHRKPVVATRAGGLPDKVIPGTTGWLVEPRDPRALGSALREAINGRALWRSYGEAGRALAGTAIRLASDPEEVQGALRGALEDAYVGPSFSSAFDAQAKAWAYVRRSWAYIRNSSFVLPSSSSLVDDWACPPALRRSSLYGLAGLAISARLRSPLSHSSVSAWRRADMTRWRAIDCASAAGSGWPPRTNSLACSRK